MQSYNFLYELFWGTAKKAVSNKSQQLQKVRKMMSDEGLPGFVENHLPEFLELSDEDRLFAVTRCAERSCRRKQRPAGESHALQILCQYLAPGYVRNNELGRALRALADRDGWITLYRGVGKAEAKLVREGKFGELGIWWTPYRDKARKYAYICGGTLGGGALVRVRVSISQLKGKLREEQFISIMYARACYQCTRPKIVEHGLLLRASWRIWHYKWSKRVNKSQQVL